MGQVTAMLTVSLFREHYIDKIIVTIIQGIVSSMCDTFHIPHFTTNWMISEDTLFDTHKFTRNFFPESNVYSRALAEIVVNFGWKSFTVLYDSNDGK